MRKWSQGGVKPVSPTAPKMKMEYSEIKQGQSSISQVISNLQVILTQSSFIVTKNPEATFSTAPKISFICLLVKAGWDASQSQCIVDIYIYCGWRFGSSMFGFLKEEALMVGFTASWPTHISFYWNLHWRTGLGIYSKHHELKRTKTLLTMTLTNILSLGNKMNKLMVKVEYDRDDRWSNLICLTEIWLKRDIPDPNLTGYTLIQ